MAEFINWREHDLDLRYCICADPENCVERVPGYICRRDVREAARTWADAIDDWIVEQVLAELRLEDLELARFEDEGGPPEPEICGAVQWYYGCSCERLRGHAGAHEGDASRTSSPLGRCRWQDWPIPEFHRRQGSWTGTSGR